MNESWPTLIPADGRDYSNKREVSEAFRQGKDFLMASTSQRCSIRNFEEGDRILLRYRKEQHAVSYHVGNPYKKDK